MTETHWQTTTTSVAATTALGSTLGALLGPTDLILLSGGLGAGKTHLTKGIVAGLGSTDSVTSPTYVFINEYHYPPRGTIFHVDLYRAEHPSELASIGLDDALAGHGPCVIEWPVRDPSLAALPHLAVTLEPIADAPGSRRCRFVAHGARAEALLSALSSQRAPEEHA